MNPLPFSPLSLSQLFKEKGVDVPSFFQWETYYGDKSRIAWKDFHKQNYIDTADYRTYLHAYSLSELPDVFRQVFGEIEDISNWVMFSRNYFEDKAKSWETLEKTIKGL